MLNPNINLLKLSKQDCNIYAKHLILESIGLSGQKRLKKAKILIIGAGGLGCPALLYLVASGIGYIGIVDHDKINISNLNRQIIYNLNDTNLHKTISAKYHLQKMQAKCKIITHTYQLIRDNAVEIIQYYDIIIDASDNFKTRYLIDKICYKLHKTHIYGAIQQFEGQVSVFNYKNNNRYSNIYPEQSTLIQNNCNQSGVIGVVTANIGIIQATEAIKIILGIGRIISNKIFICNLLTMSFKHIKYYKIKQNNNFTNLCEISRPNLVKNIILKSEIDYLKTIYNSYLLIIDIRQRNEFTTNHISKSINIPINKLQMKQTLTLIKKHSNTQKIIIYCSTIYRSTIASYILQNNNISHYILKNRSYPI